jgi:hypothetical protein
MLGARDDASTLRSLASVGILFMEAWRVGKRHMGVAMARLPSAAACCTLLAAALSFATGPAYADSPETEVIVEGTRPELEQRVHAYVSGITRRGYGTESLVRWRKPICPLVAGLTSDQGEFILYGVTQAAAAAGAPLGSEECRPNLYVVVASEPERLLERWHKRSRGLFGDAPPSTVRQFLQDEPRPVRAWYNTELVCGDGVGTPKLQRGADLSFRESSSGCFIKDTRLQSNYVDIFASVIVIVDADLIKDIKLGQLADYVAMIGLAKMDVDANVGDAPTILRLFAAATDSAPPNMSPWDRAFLEALYRTPQRSRHQRSIIANRVVRDVAAR